MTTAPLSTAQQAVVADQVDHLLAGSRAWQGLSSGERERIRRHTVAIAASMAAERLAEGQAIRTPPARGDPYRRLGVRGLDVPQPAPGTTTTTTTASGPAGAFKAEGIAAGVTQAARMIREIDFPAFVSQLVHGTFDAVVQSSISQMKAYGELVQSVAMSLNDFRDQNVSVNQGRDQLVQRYPTLFQISTDDNGNPVVTSRQGADNAKLPDFRGDLGLDEDIEDIDDETIEGKLVPAARDNYARNRQKLLATMVLMGINRIIVTDGKINAKVQFTFQARDRMTRTAQATDYENLGTMRIQQGSGAPDGSSPGYSDPSQAPTYDDQGNLIQSGQGNRYATGEYQSLEQPIIKVAETSQSNTDASVQASGSVMGEVQLNFRSDVFPLEKMVDTSQLSRLNAIQQTPNTPVAAGAAPAAPAPAAAPPTAPPAAAPVH